MNIAALVRFRAAKMNESLQNESIFQARKPENAVFKLLNMEINYFSPFLYDIKLIVRYLTD